jgi:recombination associated protein RdgC
MSLLSSSVSVTRYKVVGDIKKPVIETISQGLTRFAIEEIDNDHAEKIAGWTSFQDSFHPVFKDSSFVIGSYLVFSMRLDKKSMPPKVIHKYCAIEKDRTLEKTGREYLSRNEKKSIKEHVIDTLCLRIPATPHIYDVVWHPEESWLWFFSNLKDANEELESLFQNSFNLRLIRMFPYTSAMLNTGLSNTEKDLLSKLSHTHFKE